MKRYLFYISENYSFQILRPLQEEIRRQGSSVAWFVEGSNVNLGYFRADEQHLLSVEQVINYKPCAVFVPGNMIPSFIPGLKVSLQHGFVGFKTRVKDGLNYSFIIRECFDLYCCHGPSMTETYRKLEKKYKYFKVAETGFCKMDQFFSAVDQVNKEKTLPVILFSSTFSPRMSQARELIPIIAELSKNKKWRWLVTFHPKMDPAIVEIYKKMQHDNLTFIESDDVMPCMLEADLMLGDNSSMIVEFLMLNKPVVTFNNEHPMPHFINVTEPELLEENIEFALSKPTPLMEKIKQYTEFTHPYTDGYSSKRVLEATQAMLEEPPLTKKKPWNFIRNLRLRNKLSYWKL